jgi:hypothetical protein
MAKQKHTHRAHNGALWLRLAQLIKVEEPITFQDIKRWCPDINLRDLDYTLREMCAAKRINVARDWSGSQMIETYSYLNGSQAARVTLVSAA